MFENIDEHKYHISNKEEDNIRLLVRFLKSDKYVIFMPQYLYDKIISYENTHLTLPIVKLYYDQRNNKYLHHVKGISTTENNVIFVFKITLINKDENNVISSLMYDDDILFTSKLDDFDRYVSLLSFL